MELMIVSGRSGSGKSTALHVLEDMGYYCVDNLPVGLLPTLVEQIKQDSAQALTRLAVGVDARNLSRQLTSFPQSLEELRGHNLIPKILYLDAAESSLLRRFSETRRKHPLTTDSLSLAEAIQEETKLLAPIAAAADLTIDTTHLSIHQLRDLMSTRINTGREAQMAILFMSFGFKHGIPIEADLVFDARCLPNPHWVAELRQQTGLETPVQAYLDAQPLFQEMHENIEGYLKKWLPEHQANNRSYMTVAIGCTGGQHRSVYLAQRLANAFKKGFGTIQVRHRELNL
jgi:UPF0042 nucleotide-binding protein